MDNEIEDKRAKAEVAAGSRVAKKRKTVDEKIKALNEEYKAALKALKLAGKSKKSLTIESTGMTNLIVALQVVVSENNVSTADAIKALALIKAVGVRGKNLNDFEIEINSATYKLIGDSTKEALAGIKLMRKTTKSSVIIL